MTSKLSKQLAAWYAQHVAPTLMTVAVRTVRIAGIAPGDAVLDLGTSTGIAAFLAATQAGPQASIVGLDPSPDMLAIAHQRALQAGIAHVRWQVGNAHPLEFAHESFDAVVCVHFLHDLARPDEALAEVRRVLVPSGRVSLAVWGSAAGNPWAALLARAASPLVPSATWSRPNPFSLGSPGAIEILLQHAGFINIESERITDRLRWESVDGLWHWYAAWPHWGRVLAGLPPDAQAHLRRQLDHLARRYQTDTGLAIPREVVHARAITPPD